MSGDDEFESRSWLGAMPLAAWCLLVALTDSTALGLGPGFFLYLGIAGAGLCLGSWYLARCDLGDSARMIALRRLTLMHVLIALAFVTALLLMGQVAGAVVTAVVGVTLVALVWPAGWTLRRMGKDRTRPYRSSYVVLSLIAGGLLVGSAALNLFTATPGLAPAEEQTLGGVMLTGALAQFIQAWDERRRPRPPMTPQTHHIR